MVYVLKRMCDGVPSGFVLVPDKLYLDETDSMGHILGLNERGMEMINMGQLEVPAYILQNPGVYSKEEILEHIKKEKETSPQMDIDQDKVKQHIQKMEEDWVPLLGHLV